MKIACVSFEAGNNLVIGVELSSRVHLANL